MWPGLYTESGKFERPLNPEVLWVPNHIETDGVNLYWENPGIAEYVRQWPARYDDPNSPDNPLAEAFTNRHRHIWREPYGPRVSALKAFMNRKPTPRLSDFRPPPLPTPAAEIAAQFEHQVHPGAGMLEQFTALHSATPERIAGYARKWGILGICKHGLPWTHSHDELSGPFAPGACAPEGGPVRFHEPISAWVALAKKANAALRVAARLAEGKAGADVDWRELHDEYPSPLNDQRQWIAGFVNYWLSIGVVRPRVNYRRKGILDATWLGQGLFGALAMQMALVLCRSTGFAICTNCGTQYTPRRQPVPGRRTYCDDCRRHGAPVRDAVRAYRRRAKDGQ